MQLEVMDADGRHDVPFPPGVTGAVGEDHLVVAFACPQQAQVLGRARNRTVFNSATAFQLIKTTNSQLHH